jgi:hypothetical protein
MIDLSRPRLDELQRSIAQAIPCDPEGVRTDLEAMALPSLLIRYIGWQDRFIPPRPRKVVTWPGFLQHGKAHESLQAVLKLAERISRGEDLKPFLSNKVQLYGYVRPKKGKDGKTRGVEWRDKDYALNAFDVHHLHLSENMKTDGSARRSEELLYVSFDRQSAFLIMVGDHKSFDDGTLAHAIAEARAESGDTVKGIVGSEETFTHKERNLLHRHGITTFARAGDKIVFGAMLSGAGTSSFHTLHAQTIMCKIEANDLWLDDPENTRPWFDSAGLPYPDQPEFLWRLHYCDLCAVETSSNAAVLMLPWRR